MTTFYLIRHGSNDTVGHGISGRRAGVHLNGEGHAQAKALGERLAQSGITRVFCSPLERTRETAEPIASRLCAPLCAMDDFLEVDFGEWTGRSFGDLEKDPRWRAFNRARSVTRVPGGELMLEVQARMVAGLDRLRVDCPDERIAVVSHGDPIRAALVYYAAMPLELIQRVHVDIASVSVVSVDDHGAAMRCLNHTGPLPE